MRYKKVIGINQRAKEYKGRDHIAVWIRYKGKIPKGKLIHHKNGNKKDNRIENLECLTRKQHGKLHRKPNRKRIKYPSGAIKVIRLTE